MDYVVEVYHWCLQLPKDERYNLSDQLKRACTSVPLNIAEGAACEANTDFARFLGDSYRSLKESVTCLELCERLSPSLPEAPACLINQAEQLAKVTRSLIQRLKLPSTQEA